MEKCIECGGSVAGGQCESCGLSPLAAELAVRKRVLFSTAMFLLGAVAFFPVVAWYPPLDLDGMLIFLGVVFFVVMGLGIWLDLQARRRTMNHPLKRVFYGLIPVSWLMASLLFANGRFDGSPVQSNTTRIVSKFAMGGMIKSSRLVVNSWRLGRSVERIAIPRDDLIRYQKGDLVEVRIREGLAGIPWVESVYHKD